MTIPEKARYVARYDDGSEKMVVGYDLNSKLLPTHVMIEMGSNWLYVDVADIPQLRAFLERARKAVLANIAASEVSA